MELFRRVMTVGFGTALVGIVVASLTVPRWLSWYNQPSANGTQVLCDLAKVTQDTAHSLIMGQLIGGGVGAVLGIVGASVFAVWRRKKKAAQAA